MHLFVTTCSTTRPSQSESHFAAILPRFGWTNTVSLAPARTTQRSRTQDDTFTVVLTFAIVTGRPSRIRICGALASQPLKNMANGLRYRPMLLLLSCSRPQVSDSTAITCGYL